jgi:hypothetical protein
MKKRSLLLVLFCFLFGVSANAQEFTVSELIKMRSGTMSDFETAVMKKGYDLYDVTKDYDEYVTFKKGNNEITYGRVKNPHSDDVDIFIIYDVLTDDEFSALKGQVKENPAHLNETHFFSDGRYIMHVYAEDGVSLHFYMKHRGRAIYEVEVLPDKSDKYNHYSRLRGDAKY